MKKYARLERTGLAAALLLAGLAGTALGARGYPWPAEETEAQRAVVLQRMAEAGLSQENCFLQGRAMFGLGSRGWLFPKESSGPDLSFNDGTLCGMTAHGPGIKNLRAEDGKLKFSTTKEGEASVSWGVWAEGQPALRLGYSSGRGDISPKMGYIEMRIKQSLSTSQWHVVHKGTH